MLVFLAVPMVANLAVGAGLLFSKRQDWLVVVAMLLAAISAIASLVTFLFGVHPKGGQLSDVTIVCAGMLQVFTAAMILRHRSTIYGVPNQALVPTPGTLVPASGAPPSGAAGR
jgi:membrane protein YdbS with pleckstrin-like domain